MKITIIVVCAILAFICALMMVLEFTVKGSLRSSYRCPKCYKTNKKVAMPSSLIDEMYDEDKAKAIKHSAKCEYCGENMKSGRGYKSMFLGRRPCTDGEGNYVLAKQMGAVNVSIVIWGVLEVAAITGIVLASVLM